MIDPMANIDPSAPMGPEMDATGGGGADGNQEVFDMNAYRSNLRKMDKIRSFMGIASGCVAGVCGLTGLSGLGKCHIWIPDVLSVCWLQCPSLNQLTFYVLILHTELLSLIFLLLSSFLLSTLLYNFESNTNNNINISIQTIISQSCTITIYIESMLHYNAHHSKSLPPCIQNEIWFTFILKRVNVCILNGRFTKVRHVVYALLDIILWIGILVLEDWWWIGGGGNI